MSQVIYCHLAHFRLSWQSAMRRGTSPILVAAVTMSRQSARSSLMLMLSNRTRPPGPSLALDLYSREALLNPHETYRRIREADAAVGVQEQRMRGIGRLRDRRA